MRKIYLAFVLTRLDAGERLRGLTLSFGRLRGRVWTGGGGRRGLSSEVPWRPVSEADDRETSALGDSEDRAL